MNRDANGSGQDVHATEPNAYPRKTVQEQFDELMTQRMIWRHRVHASPLQYRELRRSFYYGFFAAITAVIDAANTDNPQDEGCHAIHDYSVECHEFFKKVGEEKDHPPEETTGFLNLTQLDIDQVARELGDFSGLNFAVNLSGEQLLHLIATLQLACRHPDLRGRVRENATLIAHVLQDAAENKAPHVSLIHEVVELGWAQSFPVPKA
jgi:hypothetical protein